jgi:hypothetical protein
MTARAPWLIVVKQLRDPFPTDEEAWTDGAPECYEVTWRGCFVYFCPGGAAVGSWEIECWNRKHQLLWNTSTCIVGTKRGKLDFGSAVREAHDMVTL